MYVDSGATETVITEQMLSAIKLHEGTQSRRGVTYEVANGVTIPNLGEKKFIAHTQGGQKRGITAQVCEVNKALLSVTKLVQQGNRLVFADNGSYIENVETGEKVWM